MAVLGSSDGASPKPVVLNGQWPEAQKVCASLRFARRELWPPWPATTALAILTATEVQSCRAVSLPQAVQLRPRHSLVEFGGLVIGPLGAGRATRHPTLRSLLVVWAAQPLRYETQASLACCSDDKLTYKLSYICNEHNETIPVVLAEPPECLAADSMCGLQLFALPRREPQ